MNLRSDRQGARSAGVSSAGESTLRGVYLTNQESSQIMMDAMTTSARYARARFS